MVCSVRCIVNRPLWMSVVAEAAADVDRLRGDRVGRGAGQVADQRGDLVWLGVAAEPDLVLEARQHVVRGDAPVVRITLADPLGQRRFYIPGADGVHRDA